MINLTVEEIKQPSLLVFTSSNCHLCTVLLENLKDFDYNIVEVNESNGAILGPKFSIAASPTTILLNNNVEVSRFYGAKTKEYVKNFIEQNIS